MNRGIDLDHKENVNLFKRFFAKKKPIAKEKVTTAEAKVDEIKRAKEALISNFEGFATEESFNKRFRLETINANLLDGTMRMISGYFEANKLKPVVDSPINHPANLDQCISEGMGFLLYCNAVKMDKNMATGILAMALNDFLMDNYSFKLFKDAKPENPMRTMTLKYDNKGAMLSVYPIEYTLKVLNHDASYAGLYTKIKSSMKNMPSADDLLS